MQMLWLPHFVTMLTGPSCVSLGFVAFAELAQGLYQRTLQAAENPTLKPQVPLQHMLVSRSKWTLADDTEMNGVSLLISL